MATQKKATLIYGSDLGDGVHADAMAIAQALAEKPVIKEATNKLIEDAVAQVEEVKPFKPQLSSYEKERLEDAGYAMESNGEAKYVVRGFDNVTLLAELNRRIQGYDKYYTATAKLVEKGPF